jgi:Rod binding domain-containing protein
MRIASASTASFESAASSQQHAKLVDAAQQFEAMLLHEMLKPMQSKEGGWSGDEETKSDGEGDTLSSYGTEAVARAIAKGGGLGIAKQVIQKVWQERSKGS